MFIASNSLASHNKKIRTNVLLDLAPNRQRKTAKPSLSVKESATIQSAACAACAANGPGCRFTVCRPCKIPKWKQWKLKFCLSVIQSSRPNDARGFFKVVMRRKMCKLHMAYKCNWKHPGSVNNKSTTNPGFCKMPYRKLSHLLP